MKKPAIFRKCRKNQRTTLGSCFIYSGPMRGQRDIVVHNHRAFTPCFIRNMIGSWPNPAPLARHFYLIGHMHLYLPLFFGCVGKFLLNLFRNVNRGGTIKLTGQRYLCCTYIFETVLELKRAENFSVCIFYIRV